MTDLTTRRATGSMLLVDDASGNGIGSLHYYQSDHSWHWCSVAILNVDTLAAVVELMRQHNAGYGTNNDIRTDYPGEQ